MWAPLDGGPSTPALAAAVSEAGGLDFVAAGYKTPAAVQAELDELVTLTSAPRGAEVESGADGQPRSWSRAGSVHASA